MAIFSSQIEKLPWKLLKGGNYSKEETIHGNMVNINEQSTKCIHEQFSIY